MGLFSYIKKNTTLLELFEEQEVCESATQIIRPFIPEPYRNQVRVVRLRNRKILIFANSGSVANHIKFHQSEILASLANWEISQLEVKVYVKY
ncbi:MAG: hypothetical protein WDW19_06075 [Neisseriaceae bacterium]